MLETVFAAAPPTVPPWHESFSNSENVGGLISTILSPLGGFGKLPVIRFRLSALSACASTMYMFCE